MSGFTRTAMRRHDGFTLIELLVVIAIVAILLGVGVPNLQSLIVSNRLTTQANDLHASLQLARSEALRRNTPVTIQALDSAGTGNWSTGWRLFADANGDGRLDAGDDELLRESPALSAPLTLYASPQFATRLSFDGRGRVITATRTLGGYFVLCHGDQVSVDGQSRSRVVQINPAGRIRMGTDTNKDGVFEIDSDTGVSAINQCIPS